VTTFRTSRTASVGSAAPQLLQNRAPAGFSAPHSEQTIRASLTPGVGFRDGDDRDEQYLNKQ
jgi:hypothetical protein